MFTHFSFRAATGSPKEVVSRLKELGYEYAPISDIASTYGFVKWRSACEKHGLKPVYGVSLYVTPAIQQKKPIVDLWTFYAIDSIKPINEIVRKAYEQGRGLPRVGFTPLLRYDQLGDIGNVIKVCGYRARLEHMNPEDENLYVGLSPACAKGFVNAASERGFKFFAHQEARYVREEDRDFYQIACGFNADLKTYPQHILANKYIENEQDWFMATKHCGDDNVRLLADMNSDERFAQCTAQLLKGDLLRPTVDKTLEEMCREGIERLQLAWPEEYEDRFQTELKVIQDKNFEDYFFLMADFMQWAKANMAVGPGRGSSAGSLICYLLGITQVDPIKYGLLFFRFLDPSRPDWPDIDSDLANRDMAIEYLENKYGKSRVAKLGTVGSFQAKNSTNETAKQLDFPRFEFNTLIDSLPDYAAGDVRADKALDVALKETDLGKRMLAKYPAFALAGRLSGTPANAATHASGVLITNDEISNYAAVNSLTNTAMLDMREAETLNLIKFDILGLSTLGIFEKTLSLAGLPRNFLDTVPLDDQAAFDILNDKKFVGLFQYEGQALRYLTSQIVVDSFDDIAIISALARPGALSSGAADAWAKRKMGKQEVSYPHPLIEPFLNETLGCMAYQETIMLVAHDVAGMDWASVSKLRKAIGKSLGPEAMREYGEPFKNGLLAKGIPQEVADKFWSDILGAGSYMFNKSHSVAYGMMSYWSCYLKAHYPIEFAAASLTATDSQEKQVAFLREMQAEGIGYVPVDPEFSIDQWSISHRDGKKFLVGPLNSVRGLGIKKVQQILSCRARKEPIPDSIMKLLENPKTDFDSLNPINEAISQINWKQHILEAPTPLENLVPNGQWVDAYIIGVVSKCEEKSENEEKKIADRIARGQVGHLDGDPKYLEVRIDSDFTKGFYCKVGKKDIDQMKERVMASEIGKSIVAIKGTLCPEAPCFLVKGFKVIGEI